jgi:hypothetical protein
VYIGIDLALRTTGIVFLDNDGAFLHCGLVTSDPKTTNNEDLLLHNYGRVMNIFDMSIKFKHESIEVVALEGLSFNSPSMSVDLIAANHWQVRSFLHSNNIPIMIIPPKSWQKNVVTKETLAEWAKDWPVTRAKRGTKLTKEEQKINNKSKAEIRKLTKDHIYNSVPLDIRKQFEEYVVKSKLHKDSLFDLADAYCLANHARIKHG